MLRMSQKYTLWRAGPQIIALTTSCALGLLSDYVLFCITNHQLHGILNRIQCDRVGALMYIVRDESYVRSTGRPNLHPLLESP